MSDIAAISGCEYAQLSPTTFRLRGTDAQLSHAHTLVARQKASASVQSRHSAKTARLFAEQAAMDRRISAERRLLGEVGASRLRKSSRAHP